MKRPKVSIIVAVYNTSEYLEKCLTQVQNQTIEKTDYEVIIVNDCSTDNSAELIDRFVVQTKNMRAIHKKKNEGTFWCRVDGMREAKGEFVGFVDSDDWIDTNMFECLIRTAEEKGVDIVECGYQDDDRENCKVHYQLKEGKYKRNEIVYQYTKRTINASLWMRLFRKCLVDRIILDTVSYLPREKYCGIRNEDEYLFPLLLNEAESYYVLHQPLYHYRIDSTGSIMSEIHENVDKKIFHGKTVIHAGQLLLEKTKKCGGLRTYYIYLQINNLFYLLGIIKRNNLPIHEYKIYYDKFFNEKYRWNEILKQDGVYGIKVIMRYVHLFIRYWQVNVDYKFIFKSKK